MKVTAAPRKLRRGRRGEEPAPLRQGRRQGMSITRCHPTCTLTMCESVGTHNKLEPNNNSRMEVSITATFIQAPAPPTNTTSAHHHTPPLSPPRPSPSLTSLLPIAVLTVPVTGRRRRREERDASILLASFSAATPTGRYRWGVAVLRGGGGKETGEDQAQCKRGV